MGGGEGGDVLSLRGIGVTENSATEQCLRGRSPCLAAVFNMEIGNRPPGDLHANEGRFSRRAVILMPSDRLSIPGVTRADPAPSRTDRLKWPRANVPNGCHLRATGKEKKDTLFFSGDCLSTFPLQQGRCVYSAGELGCLSQVPFEPCFSYLMSSQAGSE